MVTKVFVATPMYGGMCTGTYANSLMQVPGALFNSGVELQYHYITNEALITRGRNQLAYEFVNSDATHLMFIDGDIGFNPYDIISMLNCDKDIVCGVYPKKTINWPAIHTAVLNNYNPESLEAFSGEYVVNMVKDVAFKNNELIEIEHGGTGFMLIKRGVIENLITHVDNYINDGQNALDIALDKKPELIPELFFTQVCKDTKRLLSEDYAFCKLSKSWGFSIFAAPWVRLTHTGSHVFNGILN